MRGYLFGLSGLALGVATYAAGHMYMQAGRENVGENPAFSSQWDSANANNIVYNQGEPTSIRATNDRVVTNTVTHLETAPNSMGGPVIFVHMLETHCIQHATMDDILKHARDLIKKDKDGLLILGYVDEHGDAKPLRTGLP